MGSSLLPICSPKSSSRPQIAAKLNPAFAGQHPVKDEERESLAFRQLGFGFFRAGAGDHLMAALFDQTAQIASTVGMVLDQKNSHGFGKTSPSIDRRAGPALHADLEELVACLLLRSRKTAKATVN